MIWLFPQGRWRGLTACEILDLLSFNLNYAVVKPFISEVYDFNEMKACDIFRRPYLFFCCWSGGSRSFVADGFEQICSPYSYF